MIDKYNYRVAWSENDNAFIAKVLEFKSLSSHGDTVEDALSEMHKLVDEVVKDLKDKGEYVPESLEDQFRSSGENLGTIAKRVEYDE